MESNSSRLAARFQFIGKLVKRYPKAAAIMDQISWPHLIALAVIYTILSWGLKAAFFGGILSMLNC